MTDSISRFTSRVGNYAKYRPTYPRDVIDLLKKECGLTRESVIADIGSGTGILSEMFLKDGNRVFGVEPNAQMRSTAENLLQDYSQFVSVHGAAESTGLESSSVDFITAAQAFHWFQRDKARVEFARIIKPDGWAVLIWNERRVDSTLFLRDCEQMFLRFGTDYGKIRHENVVAEISGFFAPQAFTLKSFENVQNFDLESFRGRVLSASYTPEPGNSNFEPMMVRLREIFETHQANGRVKFEYDTKVYYGHLKTI
jgi:SAM-dependent methyltransferase